MDKDHFHRGLIFCAGEFTPEDVPSPEDTDLVICADGGLEHAMAVGIKPHVVLGDFDSLSGGYLQYLSKDIPTVEIHRYPVEKDKSDGQLAVEYALDAGVKEIWILGGLGGRLDHSLANLFLAWLCLNRGVTLQMLARGQCVSMVRGPDTHELHGRPGDYVSLLPLTSTVVGVTTKGLYYPLKKGTLQMGETRGLSNELTRGNAVLEVEDGTLVLVQTRRED